SCECAMPLIWQQIQLVTQTEIEDHLWEKLPIVLKKETVISRAQDAIINAVSIHRVGGRANLKIVEALEVYYTAPVVIRRNINVVVDDLGAGANAMATAGHRENINQCGRRFIRLYVTGIADRNDAARPDHDLPEPWVGVGVSSLDAEV